MGISGGKEAPSDRERDDCDRDEPPRRLVQFEAPGGYTVQFRARPDGTLSYTVDGEPRPPVSRLSRASTQGLGYLRFEEHGRGVLLPMTWDGEETAMAELCELCAATGVVFETRPLLGASLRPPPQRPAPRVEAGADRKSASADSNRPLQPYPPEFFLQSSVSAGAAAGAPVTLAGYLAINGAERYIVLFERHEFDLPRFADLNSADLDFLGVRALGARKLLLSLAQHLVHRSQALDMMQPTPRTYYDENGSELISPRLGGGQLPSWAAESPSYFPPLNLSCSNFSVGYELPESRSMGRGIVVPGLKLPSALTAHGHDLDRRPQTARVVGAGKTPEQRAARPDTGRRRSSLPEPAGGWDPSSSIDTEAAVAVDAEPSSGSL